jgi:putative membrane protein
MEPARAEGERTHVLGLLVSFVTGLPQLFFPILAVLFGTGSRNKPELIPVVIFAVLLVSLLFRWIAWLRFRFYLDEDDIRIEQGIVNRTVRSIPYDRIQDVSIEEKPLARLLGLGEVKFESGGGEGDDAKLSFVLMDRAEALRETVRERKLGTIADMAQAAPADMREQPPVFAMDNDRLVTLGLYSFSLVIFAVLGGLAQQFDFLLPFDFWEIKGWIGIAEDNGVTIDGISRGAQIIGAVFALAALVVIGVLTGIIRTVLKEYGFRLDRTERGFRRRRGFLTRTDVVMPVNRVQAANIVTGPIRKLRGWHALKLVSLAQDSKEESDFMAAPLAQLDEIWPISAVAGITAPSESSVLRRGRFAWWLAGFVILLPIICIAMAAMIVFADSSFLKATLLWLLPLFLLGVSVIEWRLYRYGIDDAQVYVRRGWWRQKLSILPQIRVQSAEVSQGPLARITGLATVHFGVAGGSISMMALPLAEAKAIRDAVINSAAPFDFSKLNHGLRVRTY